MNLLKSEKKKKIYAKLRNKNLKPLCIIFFFNAHKMCGDCVFVTFLNVLLFFFYRDCRFSFTFYRKQKLIKYSFYSLNLKKICKKKKKINNFIVSIQYFMWKRNIKKKIIKCAK